MGAGRYLYVGAVALLGACGSTPKATVVSPVRTVQRPPAGGADRLEAPLYIKDVGFQTPESVLHDTRADVYLVSNVDGSPLAADDRAFISRIRPNGQVEALKWIDAARPEVVLNAPKGMALSGEVLYVADLSVVRKFDRTSGEPLGSIEIPGATFVNDACADSQGNVYVSDSGITMGFTPSGGDAVYKLAPDGRVTIVAKHVGLGRPNGLLADGSSVWVATFGSGELYRLDAGGERLDAQKLPKGSLDGIARWDNRVFVSSWEASAIYERVAEEFVERVSDVPAPSDIGFDQKRKRLLVPLFYDNTLIIYQL